MHKYLLINHGVGAPANWEAYFEMLHAGGHMIGGSALDHGIAVQIGTVSEARSKTITGYLVIQAADLETAKQIALQSPVHMAGGTVEVFTLV